MMFDGIPNGMGLAQLAAQNSKTQASVTAARIKMIHIASLDLIPARYPPLRNAGFAASLLSGPAGGRNTIAGGAAHGGSPRVA
jgi:hypothetical protein